MPSHESLASTLPPKHAEAKGTVAEHVVREPISELVKHLGSPTFVRANYQYRTFILLDREKELLQQEGHVIPLKRDTKYRSNLAIAKAKKELLSTEETDISHLSETAQSYLLLNKLFGNRWRDKDNPRRLITLPLPELLKIISEDDKGFGQEWKGTLRSVTRNPNFSDESGSSLENSNKAEPKQRPPDPLADVVVRAKAGDQNAIAELVDASYGSAYTLAHKLTGNEHDARDVVQEAYVRMLRSIKQFRGESTFNTWMYRIVTNCANKLLTKRTKNAHEELTGSEPLADLRHEVDPESMLETSADRGRLTKALAGLSPNLRAVVVLRDVYDLPHEAIAEELSISVEAAKVRLHRARRKLREALFPTQNETDEVTVFPEP